MDFSSRNDGRWFWFNGQDETAGGVCLRVMSVGEAKRIDKLVTTSKYKPIRGQITKVENVDEDLKDRLTWDYCIVDWKGVILDGQVVEPTPENKVKMMTQCIAFAQFFVESIAVLNEEYMINTEATEKN